LIKTPGLNCAPLIWTGVFGGPDEGVIVNIVVGVIVREAVPEKPEELAVMVVLPIPRLVASPVLETVATELFEDDHVAVAVTSWMLLSEKCSVAVNCWVWPAAMEAVVGETVTLTGTPAMTVNNAVPNMSPEVAVMVVAPRATPLARPWDPALLDTVAVAGTDDDHVTEVVRFWVLRSE
jgi:hypothetical protein